jgi:hypothetical protein
MAGAAPVTNVNEEAESSKRRWLSVMRVAPRMDLLTKTVRPENFSGRMFYLKEISNE